MPPSINWFKFIRGLSFVPASLNIMLVSLLSVYDTSANTLVKKPYWYNVTYAVRGIVCVTTLYTALRIIGSNKGGATRWQVFYAVHYSLIMLVSCAVIYFDPATTVLLVAKNLELVGRACQGLSVTYLIIVIIYISIFIISEWRGEKVKAEQVEEGGDD